MVVRKKFSGQTETHSAKSSEGSPGFIDGRPQLPWLHEPTEHQFPAFLIVKYVGIIFATDTTPFLTQYFKQRLPDLPLVIHIESP